MGRIHMIEMSHSFSPTYNDWVFNEALGGGPLLSSGIYAVQLILWLFGDIVTIHGEKNSTPSGVERQYILTGRTDSGVLFICKNSTLVKLDSTARIYGEKGYVEIPQYWKARKATFHITGQEPQTVEFPCTHELSYEAAHIADCMEKGLLVSPVVTEELSVKGIAALSAVKANW